MCVSLLERVKQGKSNIILILILSARSQDRDVTAEDERYEKGISIHSVARPRPLAICFALPCFSISIHSVARPRRGKKKKSLTGGYFNPLGRKTETSRWSAIVWQLFAFQSTRSQDRDHKDHPPQKPYKDFNPLGRKTETIHAAQFRNVFSISIHSVARPRRIYHFLHHLARYFNPLGRKTETFTNGISRYINNNFNPLGRKTETSQPLHQMR